ncbi:MAG: hypothetical protein RL693_466 [Verrucomicrobiota bacterium]|jgi:hypothetical protein
MVSTIPTSPNLIRLHRALADGFYVETRCYEPDGSYVDWQLAPLEDGRFHLRGNPVEVQHDAAAGAFPSWPGKTVDHYCESDALLVKLGEIIGADHVVDTPPPLHHPADSRVQFHHRMGNFTLVLREGSFGQSLLIIPFVSLILAFLGLMVLIPFLDGWGQGNWLFPVFGAGGILLFGWLLIPFAVKSLCGRVLLKVENKSARLTRGRAWWKKGEHFRWDAVESLELAVTRTKKFGASTTAQFVLKDGSRVDYATRMLKRPFEEAVKTLQSLLGRPA